MYDVTVLYPECKCIQALWCKCDQNDNVLLGKTWQSRNIERNTRINSILSGLMLTHNKMQASTFLVDKFDYTTQGLYYSTTFINKMWSKLKVSKSHN